MWWISDQRYAISVWNTNKIVSITWNQAGWGMIKRQVCEQIARTHLMPELCRTCLPMHGFKNPKSRPELESKPALRPRCLFIGLQAHVMKLNPQRRIKTGLYPWYRLWKVLKISSLLVPLVPSLHIEIIQYHRARVKEDHSQEKIVNGKGGTTSSTLEPRDSAFWGTG